MKYKIHGETMPILILELEDGEKVYSESGNMAYMTPNIKMSTATQGVFRAFKRIFAGESLFLNEFQSKNNGVIGFNSEFPGRIIALELDEKEIVCQKDAFMCAQEGVELSIHIQRRVGTGFFGGEGFIMQKLSGKGMAFLEISGEVTQLELSEDEELLVDTGHIAMFEPSVDFDVQVLSGGTNMLFGGEGLFLAKLKGPGKIWLQSLPIKKFAGKIGSYIARPQSTISRLFGGL